MSQALKILMISSECIPFAKAGGLADVVPSLAKQLALMGHDVRIIMPRYYFIDRSSLARAPNRIEIPVLNGLAQAGLYSASLDQTNVNVYFVEYENLYGRDGIYASPGESEFVDNALRFAFLNKAAFSACRMLNWIPDVIHGHDWPCAPSMAMLNSTERTGDFKRSAGVFTIHNVGYQGLFPAEQFPVLGMPWTEFKLGSFEFWGKLNFMQGALRHAGAISTVSPRYAEEIKTVNFGFGMEGILTEKSAKLTGILNGMDYQAWNPQSDELLAKNFDVDSLGDKQANKLALQKELGLEVNQDLAVIGIISRLVSQKGFVELAAPGFGSLSRILADFPVQLVILGTGERWCEDELARLSKIYPNLKLVLAYNERLSHLIQAGSDFFLMPSLYEPCGLTQMYALRYGTIPIVAPSGGLADTVKDLKIHPKTATGIYIQLPVTPEHIYQSVRSAVTLWMDRKPAYRSMQERAMKLRFSWEESAKEYEKIYLMALSDKRGQS